VITIVGQGNCSIRNSQSGNATYSSAPTVEYTFVVAAAVSTFTITYFSNGASGGSAPADTTGNGSVTLATNSGNLENTGFTFEGWNTQANGSGTNYAEGATYNLTADVSLYAKWVAVPAASYTLTFDANFSSGGSVPVAITGTGSKTLPGNSGVLLKTSYIFKGWNTEPDGSGTRYLAGANFNLIADTTLFADWVLTPAVIYSPNGATGGVTPNDIPANSPITIDPNTGNLVRAGYRFLGWNTEPDGSGTSYAAGSTPTLPAGTTLYAAWEELPEPLASTGGTPAPLMPVALLLVTLGAILSLPRKYKSKH
jgi:uncharacterized repeat protein (TIGR02543 family)